MDPVVAITEAVVLHAGWLEEARLKGNADATVRRWTRRMKALEEAARTGLATGTDPITLVQESGDQKGMLIFRPVFSGGKPKRLLGFAMAVLRMGALLGVEDTAPALPMQLSLLRKEASPELLASTGETGGLLVARPSGQRPVFAFGKVFAVTTHSEREFLVLWHHPGQASLLALLVGLLMTSALAVLVGVLLRRREELERLVTEMTKNQLIARHARDPLLLVALDGGILDGNHAAEKLYGYSRAELLQLRIGDLRTLESPEMVSSQMQQAQRRGILFEATHVCKNGAAVPVEVNSQSIFFEGQEMLLSVIRDITERKMAQDALLKAHFELEDRVKNRTEELNRSKAQLQLLLDSTAEAIYGIDTDGDCTFCNQACLRMLGYESEDELLGKNMHWQIHHKHADGTHFPVEECRIFRAFQENEDSHVDDEVVWRADGTSFPVEYWSYPQRIDGVAVGAVVTFIDITERKRAEGAVLQNLARAEELARLKSRFVSMASHELRTPLANIMLACELLKNFGAEMPAKRSQAVLSGLLAGVTSMARTLDDLLLAGKLEEGKLPCLPVRFPLLDFLKNRCLEAQPKLSPRIEIAFRDAGLSVMADERLLRHVMINLLENALKYSPPDTKIELGVEAGPDSLTLSVRDRGIGVPEAEREFLFDAFSRASNVGDTPGSGLGLFVAQKCARAHGGHMRVTPLPDGSVFSVTIPLSSTTDMNPTT